MSSFSFLWESSRRSGEYRHVPVAILPSHSCVVCCRLALSYRNPEFSCQTPSLWIWTLCSLVSFAPASPDAMLPFWPLPALWPSILCPVSVAVSSCMLGSLFSLQCSSGHPHGLAPPKSSELPNLLLFHSCSMKINLVPGLFWASLPHFHTQVETTKPLQVMSLRHLLVLFPCLVISDSLQPHGLQHTRPPYPLLSPWVCSNSRPLSLSRCKWCHSVMPSNHLIRCPPLLLLTSIFPSIRIFSSESAHCIRWPKWEL